jgi:hypothetical protein
MTQPCYLEDYQVDKPGKNGKTENSQNSVPLSPPKWPVDEEHTDPPLVDLYTPRSFSAVQCQSTPDK